MAAAQSLSLKSALWQVDLVPAWGGSWLCLRYCDRGRWHDVGRPALAPARSDGDRLGLTAWPLLPYSGRVPGGKVLAHFDDECAPITLAQTDLRFTMPIHGVGWMRPWRVAHASAQRCSLVLDEPASDWPWAFHAEHTVMLEGNCVRVSLSVRNDAQTDMPCGLGWHPYFTRTAAASLRAKFEWRHRESPPGQAGARDCVRDRWQGGGAVPLSELAPVDHCHGGWDGRATLTWPEWNLALDLSAGPALARHCVLFAPAAADFICIEPVSHANYALSTLAPHALADGIVRLAPGERLEGEISLSMRAAGAHALQPS